MNRNDVYDLVEVAVETGDLDALARVVGYCRCVYPGQCCCLLKTDDPEALVVRKLFSAGPIPGVRDRLRGYLADQRHVSYSGGSSPGASNRNGR
jgi:hypothetical protein